MAKAIAYSATGTKSAESVNLPKDIFELEVTKHEALHLAVRRHLAASRNANAKTLKKGEVRGGGKKPWRQKGTGNARVGSIRSPIWRGGGITFGPTGNENFEVKMTKKAKQLALRQALSLRAADGVIKVIAEFAIKDGKTKEVAAILKKLGADRTTLIITDKLDELASRAVRNFAGATLKSANFVTVYEVLTAHHIIFTKSGLAALSARFSKSSKQVKSKPEPKPKVGAKS